MIELLKSDNNSAIINANINDGVINAGLIVVMPLSDESLIFRGDFDDYLVELPSELFDQGITSSMVDIDLPFRLLANGTHISIPS